MAQAKPTDDRIDAITLLTDDHRTVDGLFLRYETTTPAQSPEEKKAIVDEIVRELTVHAEIEEKVLYPEVRRSVRDGEATAEEAEQEHAKAKLAMESLQQMDPANELFDEQVRSLIADVRHHAHEEEGEMFGKLREDIGIDRLYEMGEEMAKLKSDLGVEHQAPRLGTTGDIRAPGGMTNPAFDVPPGGAEPISR